MSDFTPERPFGLLDGDTLDDDALRRAAKGALAFVAFSTKHDDNAALISRWENLIPEVPITDAGHIDSVREAIIACAQRNIVILVTSDPKSPQRFVGAALQGAAAATEYDIPCVVLTVLRNGTREGGLAWLTDTGDISGYGAIFAVAYAQVHGLEATFITPTGGVDKVRTEQAVQDAKALAAKATVPMSVVSDPAPLQRVLRDKFRIAVHPVLDAPTGINLLHHGELPKKATAAGNPAAVVKLLEEFPGDVVAVFDSVQLLHGEIAGGRIAAGVALSVMTLAGAGSAISPAYAAGESGPTGNTSVVQVDGSWYTTVTDVVNNLHFTAYDHQGSSTALRVDNKSGHQVTIEVVGYHGHGGSESGMFSPTIEPHATSDLSAGGGTKHWSTAVLTHIDGIPLEHPITLVEGGVVVTMTPQQITHVIDENAPTLVVTPDKPVVIQTGANTPPVGVPGPDKTGESPLVVPDAPLQQVPETGIAPVAPVPVAQETPAKVISPDAPNISGGQRQEVGPGSQGSFTGGTEVVQEVTGSYGPTVVGGSREPMPAGSQGSFTGESPLVVPEAPLQQTPEPGIAPVAPLSVTQETPSKVASPDATVATPTPAEQVTPATPPSESPSPDAATSTPELVVETVDQGATTPTAPQATPVEQAASKAPHHSAGDPTQAVVPDASEGEEELAHTGSTALLLGGLSSILLAAGAGLAIAGRKRGEHES